MLVDLKVYTLIHVVVSVLGILSGLVVVGGLISGRRLTMMIHAFLVTTLITAVSGFGFPFSGITPAHIVGVVSLLTLGGAFVAIYGKKLRGGWHQVFVVLAVISLYLNVFVLFAQLLQKTPALAALAPAPSSPAFAATQGIVLAIFVLLGRAALKGSASDGVA
jgi:hypothetical protein